MIARIEQPNSMPVRISIGSTRSARRRNGAVAAVADPHGQVKALNEYLFPGAALRRKRGAGTRILETVS